MSNGPAIAAYQKLVEDGVSPILQSENIIFSMTNPGIDDQRYSKLVEQFLEDLSVSTFDTELPKVADKTMALAGWIGAQIVRSAAARYAYGGRSHFASGIFEQNRYVLFDNLVIGDYGGVCASNTPGLACRCNQGGRRVHLSRLTVTEGVVDIATILFADFSYPLDVCYPDNIRIYDPVHTLTMNATDNQLLTNVVQQYDVGVSNTLIGLTDKHPISIEKLEEATAEISAKIRSTEYTNPWDVTIGPIPAGVVPPVNSLIIDPLYAQEALVRQEPRLLYTCPTLDQQIYVLVKYANTTHQTNVTAFVRGDFQSVSNAIETATTQFLTPNVYIVNAEKLPSVAPFLAPTGLSLLINIRREEVEDIMSFLDRHGEAVVAITFDDLTKYYDSFSAAMTSVTGWTLASQVIFATNLPPWKAASWPSSEFQDHFLDTVREEDRTPAAMRGFLATLFLSKLSDDLETITSENFLSSLHSHRYVTLYGFKIGPYTAPCAEESVFGCGSNFGARIVAVWNYRRVLDPSIPELAQGEPVDVVYTVEKPTEIKTRIPNYAIFLTCIFAALVLILLAVLLYCGLYRTVGDTRDNRYAPKDSETRVTIIFTDIESSTALWSTIPELMCRAVALHHKMIRSLIANYKCYEVKTIGDAFMIASADADAAIQLAKDLQIQFVKCDWGTVMIDSVYRTLNLKKRSILPIPIDPGRLSDAPCKAVWNGLRVRVGIHTGKCDINFDAVTKGYDYYGDTPNTAARTESLGCGGQVIMTHSTFNELSQGLKDQITVSFLGPQYLRGLANPIDMYDLQVIPNRSFPKLSTERDATAEMLKCHEGMAVCDILREARHREDNDENDEEPEAARTRIAEKTKESALILKLYLQGFSTRNKTKLLEEAMKQQSMDLPHSRRYPAEDYCTAMIDELAQRAAFIMNYREKATQREAKALQKGHGDQAQVTKCNPLCSTTLCCSPQGSPATQSISSMTSPVFLHGVPNVTGNDLSLCFDSADARLFRITDSDSTIWAYFNDTNNYMMHVTFSIGGKSRFKIENDVVFTSDIETGRMEGVIHVPPLCTRILGHGMLNGYKFSYSARKLRVTDASETFLQ